MLEGILGTIPEQHDAMAMVAAKASEGPTTSTRSASAKPADAQPQQPSAKPSTVPAEPSLAKPPAVDLDAVAQPEPVPEPHPGELPPPRRALHALSAATSENHASHGDLSHSVGISYGMFANMDDTETLVRQTVLDCFYGIIDGQVTNSAATYLVSHQDSPKSDEMKAHLDNVRRGLELMRTNWDSIIRYTRSS